jgi:hypothetical protein
VGFFFFFVSPKRVMSGVGVIAGVQNDASCAFKPLQVSYIYIIFFIGEYTIIIPSFTKSKCKNEASLLVLLGFVGLHS